MNQHFVTVRTFSLRLSQHEISTAEGCKCAHKSNQVWHPFWLFQNAAVLDAFVTLFPSKTVKNNNNDKKKQPLTAALHQVKTTAGWRKMVPASLKWNLWIPFITLALEWNLLQNLMAFRASLDTMPHSGRMFLFPVTGGGLWLHRGGGDNGLWSRRPRFVINCHFSQWANVTRLVASSSEETKSFDRFRLFKFTGLLGHVFQGRQHPPVRK